LARAIKSDIEAALPPQLGTLARIGQAFRRRAAALPVGRRRRNFWADFYFGKGAVALDGKGASAAGPALETLLGEHLGRAESAGHVDLVGAGPGDPELLTLKARKALDGADVVIHDRLVAPEILELARREATLLDVGKTGFGPATSQHDINALMVRHAQGGAHVVRLKSGDPTVFGRLDEEIEALDGAAISWRIVPGITAASAAVAGIGQSLTKRHRNSAIRLLTGHDTRSFAEHDWRTLAQPDEVAAIYMGKKSARFVQGRLLMHGAAPATPVTIVENATRPDQRIVATTLADLAADLDNARLTGPALMLYGLAPRAAQALSGTLLKKVVSR
ncbi:MAG: uroporphyrinogen-III C-methyltransferase, partial [Halocynthiibacter sp.]